MVVCRFEPLSYLLLNGLPDLAFEMWNEAEVKHEYAVYNPDWEAYQNMENKNVLRFISMRESGNLIGYASICIENEIHQAGLVMASFSDIFVMRGKRGYAATLVRFIEKQLSDLGVKRVLSGDRTGTASAFWEAMGYIHQENILGKTIN